MPGLARLAVLRRRVSDLLPRRDDGHGQREYLRERTRGRSQQQLGGGREGRDFRPLGQFRCYSLDVGGADERVEEEIRVFCGYVRNAT